MRTIRIITAALTVVMALLGAGSLVMLTTTWNRLPFLAATLALGGAGGLLDAGYGVGSTLGPLLVTAVLAVGWSWRVAFGVLAVADVLLAAVRLVSLREFAGVVAATWLRSPPRPALR